MLKTANLIFCLLVANISFAQNWYDDNQLYPGVVITKGKTLYRGNIVYKQSSEMLTCFTSTDQLVFNATDLFYVQFYDSKKQLNRFFYSLSVENNESRLFELLLKGDISLYRKSFLSNNSIEHHANTTFIHLGQKVDYQLYYEYQGIINKLEDFKKEILPLMSNNINSVSSFIINNQLDLNEYKDQLLLIDYYNSLSLVSK